MVEQSRLQVSFAPTGRVLIEIDGGHGGDALPSSGDRGAITMQTVVRDSLVKTLTEPGFVPGDRGAPKWLGDILALIVARYISIHIYIYTIPVPPTPPTPDRFLVPR